MFLKVGTDTLVIYYTIRKRVSVSGKQISSELENRVQLPRRLNFFGFHYLNYHQVDHNLYTSITESYIDSYQDS